MRIALSRGSVLQAHSNIGNLSDGHDLRIEFLPWSRMRLQTKAMYASAVSRPSCGRRIESDRDRLQGIRPEIGCGYLWAPGPRAVRLVP